MFCDTAYDAEAWSKVASSVAEHPEISGVIVYGNIATPVPQSSVPMLQHLAGAAASAKAMTSPSGALQVYHYAGVVSHLFATPFQEAFDYSNEAISHTRNLAFLKPLMGGPYFDLEAIWEEHTYYEFETRSVPDTMDTMVQEPYVNHIPTVRLFGG
jgi:carboxymethylenebutenolidase